MVCPRANSRIKNLPIITTVQLPSASAVRRRWGRSTTSVRTNQASIPKEERNPDEFGGLGRQPGDGTGDHGKGRQVLELVVPVGGPVERLGAGRPEGGRAVHLKIGQVAMRADGRMYRS